MKRAVLQRINDIKDYYSLSDNAFAGRVGIPQTTLSNIFIRDSDIKYSYLKKIVTSFGDISSDWLITGEGSMLKSETNIVSTPINVHAIKYYPNIKGSMGGVSFLDNPNEDFEDIALPGFSDCQYAINAYGDSMSPLIKSGQIVVLREWNEHFIDWGKIYLVVTKSGYRAIKYLMPSEHKGRVICKSENEKENPPFEVDYDNDVHKIYLVKGWICKEAI